MSRFGSSPRVRGTFYMGVINSIRGRFIPACAGNISPATIASGMGSVHPRVCGEHGFAAMGATHQFGSSPRVRGTSRDSQAVELDSRFIPACAGNIGVSPSSRSPVAVHPRVCGEHRIVVHSRCSQSGSSPRVRGTSPGVIRRKLLTRFIPACAGNMRGAAPASGHSPVHPRVCGEHCVSSRSRQANIGSSPRVRGT